MVCEHITKEFAPDSESVRDWAAAKKMDWVYVEKWLANARDFSIVFDNWRAALAGYCRKCEKAREKGKRENDIART